MDLASEINHKHVLLDTGVIIQASTNFDYFEAFFKFLTDSCCAPVYFPFIEFEFIRGAFEKEHKQKRKEFLHTIAYADLGMPDINIVTDAIKIANAYSARKHNSASLVDCCIAAYMMKFKGNLLLATLNPKDFPTFLFKCIGIYPLDTNKELFPIVFLNYDKGKTDKIGLQQTL